MTTTWQHEQQWDDEGDSRDDAAEAAAIKSGNPTMTEEERAFYPADDPTDQLVPAPVKAVLLAGWTARSDGFIECDLLYDPNLGLVVPAEQEEY